MTAVQAQRVYRNGIPRELLANGEEYDTHITVDTVADLELLPRLRTPRAVYVRCFSVIGDGGGGTFDWDPTSTETAVTGMVVGTGTGRWIRRFTGVVHVSWFGGLPDATYQHSDGKWYTDNTHTTEARDTRAQLLAALDFVMAQPRGGTMHIDAGNWYVKSAPTGPHREFFFIDTDNITVEGEGEASAIRLGIGFNAAGLGYSCVFGRFDPDNGANSCKFRRFLVDHNSDFNQFPAGGYADVSYPQNSAVSFQVGDSILYSGVRFINFSGVFALLLGSYGFPERTTNARIENCTGSHLWDDPHAGDSSVIAGGWSNGICVDCSVENGTSTNWPAANFATAYEIHGNRVLFSRNRCRDMGTGLIPAADSTDLSNYKIVDNVFENVIGGINGPCSANRSSRNIEISGNRITVRPGSPITGGEFGINVGGSVSGNFDSVDGTTIENVVIVGNKVSLVGGRGTGDISIGIVASSKVIAGLTIDHNDVFDFGDQAIQLPPNASTHDDNDWSHVSIQKNNTRGAVYGVHIATTPGAPSAVLKYLTVKDNNILDDGDGVLVNGVYLTAYTDATCVIGPNNIVGHSGIPTVLSRAIFPNAVQKYQAVLAGSPTVLLGDSDSSVSVADGTRFELPEGTLTDNRSKTVATSGSPLIGEIVEFWRFDATAHTLDIIDGGPGGVSIFTFPPGLRLMARVKKGATNWSFLDVRRISQAA